jgi:hypothetical protein
MDLERNLAFYLYDPNPFEPFIYQGKTYSRNFLLDKLTQFLPSYQKQQTTGKKNLALTHIMIVFDFFYRRYSSEKIAYERKCSTSTVRRIKRIYFVRLVRWVQNDASTRPSF